jgi:hypothetical protein
MLLRVSAPEPNAELANPVVLFKRVFAPTAVMELPEELQMAAQRPTAVLLSPVLASSALNPTAVPLFPV